MHYFHDLYLNIEKSILPPLLPYLAPALSTILPDVTKVVPQHLDLGL